MAMTTKELGEAARKHPRVRSVHRQCPKCRLWYWVRIWKRHVAACGKSTGKAPTGWWVTP